MAARSQGAAFPRRRCNPQAHHTLYLVYEPRNDGLTVFISGAHEFSRTTNQRITSHPPNPSQLKKVHRAFAEVCTRAADHGLAEPVWHNNTHVTLSQKHVTDRDWVLLQIAERIQELQPNFTVKLRFADTDCINDCCR
ncbi:MAG TPA: hypothetical protein VJ843_01745 [Candidatus Saccharimonadales bacterium]|nr:hypothetical protein [Candidatus Saccharimonadales bacterium]